MYKIRKNAMSFSAYQQDNNSTDAIIAQIELELQNNPSLKQEILSLWNNTSTNTMLIQDTPPEEAQEFQSFQLPTGSYAGLPSFYCYDNYVVQQYNTCGQAVIGSFVDFNNKNPFNLQRTVQGLDNKPHYDNAQFIGRIFNEFGPNYPFINGVTVRETIINACKKYGLNCNEYYPAAFSNGVDSRNELTNWIAKYRHPVAVLVDSGTNIFSKPQAYTLHWCIVYAYDNEGVYIATWEKSFKVNWQTFMDAWHCWWLPYPNNYYQLRAWG
jgi:hypothetical protein